MKKRAWNRAEIILKKNNDELGPEVGQPEGITVFVTAIGAELYVSQKMEERLAKERELCEAIPTVPDLQCTWQLLLQSANPRANHTMRTMPPSISSTFAARTTRAGGTLPKILLGGVPGESETQSQQLSTLPMRMAGRGLRSTIHDLGFFRPGHLCQEELNADWPSVLSHSSLKAGIVFSRSREPTTAECTALPRLFLVLLLERLNLPLPITEATCNGCHDLWTHTDDTEQRAHDLADFGSGLLQQSQAKRGPGSSTTRTRWT